MDAAQEGKTSEGRSIALRVMTMPRDANVYGTIFGGVILGYVDQAAFVEARKHGQHRWVTAAMDRVAFTAPVRLGDVVNFYTRTVRTGTSSVTVRVEVEAERHTPGPEGPAGSVIPVTEATLVMVAVDAEGRPIPYTAPATV